MTNRDHLEAIHDHLRYIYDRLDDLLDRIHVLETNQRNWNLFCAVDAIDEIYPIFTVKIPGVFNNNFDFDN